MFHCHNSNIQIQGICQWVKSEPPDVLFVSITKSEQHVVISLLCLTHALCSEGSKNMTNSITLTTFSQAKCSHWINIWMFLWWNVPDDGAFSPCADCLQRGRGGLLWDSRQDITLAPAARNNTSLALRHSHCVSRAALIHTHTHKGRQWNRLRWYHPYSPEPFKHVHKEFKGRVGNLI